MATLINKVRAITGSSSTISSGTEVVGFLESGAKYVLRSLPRGLLTEASTITSVNHGNGIEVEREWVLSVARNNFPAVEQAYEESYAYYTTALTTDGSVVSWFQATTIFPKYYWGPSTKVGKVSMFIKPDPTTAATAKVLHIETPKMTTATTEWSIDNYEIPALNYAAALDYKAMQSHYLYNAGNEALTILTEFTSSLAKYEAALPSWTSPTMGAIPATITASISYTDPSTSTYALPSALSFSATLPTWSSATLAAIPTTITASIAYTPPSSTLYMLSTALTLTESLPTWSSASLSVSPSTITPNITYTGPSTSTYKLSTGLTFSESFPTWSSATLGAARSTITASLSYTAPSGYVLPLSSATSALATSLPTWSTPTYSESITDITSALSKAMMLMGYSTLLSTGTAFGKPGDAEAYLGMEDEELVRANLAIVNGQLDRARTALQREANKINVYQAEVQMEVSRMQSVIANYRSELEKVAQFQQLVLRSYELEQNDSSQTLNADTEEARLQIQNWLNVSNDIVNRYQSEVQNLGVYMQSQIANVQAEYEREVAQANAWLQRFQSQQTEAQGTMQAAAQEAQLEIQNWANVAGDIVARYQAEVQNETSRMQAELLNYQAELEKQIGLAQNLLATYTAKQKDALADLDAETQETGLKIQNWANVVNNLVSRFQAEAQTEGVRTGAEVDKYRAEVERQVASAQNLLSVYMTKQKDSESDLQAAIQEQSLQIQNWANVANNVINKYQAEVQKEIGRYGAELEAAKGYLEEGLMRINKFQVLGTFVQTAAQYGQASMEMFRQASHEIDRHIAASLGIPMQSQEANNG